MRKSSLFLVVTLVAALFAGCVKESGNVEDDGYTYEKGTVSFALPAPGKKVTYTRASTEAGEADVASLLIYQFNGSTVEKVYATADLLIDDAGEIFFSGSTDANRVATINVGEATGARTFYLVANVNGEGQVQSAALAGITEGSTEISAFEDGFVTDNLEEVLALATPLPMSGEVVVENVTTPGFKEATLTRRVARFDIVNHADFTGLTVTGVIVREGNLSGEILDNEHTTGTTGNGQKALVANGIDDLDDTDYVDPAATTLELNAAGLAKSLNAAQFYLYPTTVTSSANTGTEILLEGMYRGIPHVYPLTLEGNVLIEANHVYQIVVNRPTTPVNEELFTFSLLKVAPWEEYAGTVIGSGIVESEFSGLLDKNGTPVTLEDGVYDFSDLDDSDDGMELRAEYQSTSALAPEVTLESVDRGDEGITPQATVEAAIAVVKEPSVLTRAYGGTVYYKHVITVKLAQPGVPVKATLTITDQERDEARVYTLFTVGRYNGIADLKPVLVAGKFWAPVNCGATTIVTDFLVGQDGVIPKALENIGYFYQWGRKTPFWPGEIPTTTEKFESIEAAGESNVFYYGDDFLADVEIPATWPASQDPCPEGWHVPTGTLAAESTSYDWNMNRHALAIWDDEDHKLWFPISGSLYGDETAQWVGWETQSWDFHWGAYSTILSSGGSAVPSLSTYTNNAYYKGLPIRCVAI
jgi:hypothetical protein